MRFHAIIICIMVLAGMVSPFLPDIVYGVNNFEWLWHDRVMGCRNLKEFRNGADLLNKYRPIGLTRKECISIFGKPVCEGRSSMWKSDDGRKVELDEVQFAKRDIYSFCLYFDGDLCFSLGLDSPVCQNKLHWDNHSDAYSEKIRQSFTSVNHSQPNFKRTKKYQLAVTPLNEPTSLADFSK